MKAHRAQTVGILIVAVAFVSFGCASAPPGTVVAIQQSDLASLAGVWNGWVYSGADGLPGELTLRPDGSFNNSVGAFTSTGTFQIQNGSLVSNPYTSGGVSAVAEQTITVQLIVRNGQRYLSGAGRGYSGGPYSFEYSKR